VKRYISLLLVIGLAYGQGVCQYDNYNLTFTGQTKSENGKFTKQYRCANNHYYWIIASQESGYKGSVYQGGRGIASQNRTFFDDIGDSIDRKRELKQNERIELAKMTPEQREYYLKVKAEEKRRNQIRNQESRTCLKQIFIGVAVYGLLYEINRVGLKRALSS